MQQVGRIRHTRHQECSSAGREKGNRGILTAAASRRPAAGSDGGELALCKCSSAPAVWATCLSLCIWVHAAFGCKFLCTRPERVHAHPWGRQGSYWDLLAPHTTGRRLRLSMAQTTWLLEGAPMLAAWSTNVKTMPASSPRMLLCRLAAFTAAIMPQPQHICTQLLHTISHRLAAGGVPAAPPLARSTSSPCWPQAVAPLLSTALTPVLPPRLAAPQVGLPAPAPPWN